MKTGLNTAFIINAAKREELIRQDNRLGDIIKPLIMGDHIRRWHVEQIEEWLIYATWELDISLYPVLEEHLSQWKQRLASRPECKEGRHNWWCLSRYAADYFREFEKPKLVFPDIAKEARFAFDLTGAYLGNTAYIIPVNDLYLLGVLNSNAVEEFYIELSAQVRGGYLRFIRQYVEQIPIPTAPESERQTIAALVQKCLNAKGIGCEAWEQEINARVAALYGL